MDPIDRLRALREDSRWTPAEFELDASPASVSRPVRGRRVSGADAWRHWLPRVGLGALAAAAVVGLVVAAVNAGLGAPAPAPNVAGPIASSSSEPKPASTAIGAGPMPQCDWSDFSSKLTVGGEVGGVTLAEVKFTYVGAEPCLGGGAEPTVRWVVTSGGKPHPVGNASTSAMPDVAFPAVGVVVTPGMSSYARIDIDDQGLFATGDCIGSTPDRLEFVFDGWGAGSSTAIDYVDASLVTSPCAASSSVHLLTYHDTYQSTLQRDVLERQAAEAAKQAAAEAAHHAATTAPTGH